MKRIAIIGGGAAGLVAGVAAAEAWLRAGEEAAGLDVAVLEMDARVGRRILVTGNGRCNFSNDKVCAAVYRNAAFVERVFARVPREDVWAFFEDLGLVWTTEPDGRMLPRTGKASTVVDVLRARMAVRGVRECCDARVVRVMPPNADGGAWTLALSDGRFERAEAVIVATGGQDALGFLPDDVEVAPFTALLGPLKTEAAPIRGLDGVRVRAEVSLARGEEVLARECGEVLFRKYGLSGICVFNLSRFAEQGDEVRLNLFPDSSADEVLAMLDARAERAVALDAAASVDALFSGMLLPSVAAFVCRAADISAEARLADAQPDDFARLAQALTAAPLRVEGIAEPAQCQVHRGGVPVEAVTDALESSAHEGLFFAGEALDVDGPCGGYNLHWAWASGMSAAANAVARLRGDALACERGGETCASETTKTLMNS